MRLSKTNARENDFDSEKGHQDFKVSREQGYILGPMRKLPSKFGKEIENAMNPPQSQQLHPPVIEEEVFQEEAPKSEPARSDSDDGLPPPILPSKPAGLGFKLNIGGLSLSTVAKDGGKTAEQLADMQQLKQSMNEKEQAQDSKSSDQSSKRVKEQQTHLKKQMMLKNTT